LRKRETRDQSRIPGNLDTKGKRKRESHKASQKRALSGKEKRSEARRRPRGMKKMIDVHRKEKGKIVFLKGERDWGGEKIRDRHKRWQGIKRGR